MKIVLITGGFDPLHSGHIKYFEAAKQLGDILIVGLNSDEWLTRKKGKPFMPFNERRTIVQSIACVDNVINFNDADGSARDAIVKVKAEYPNDTIIFANGGDRTQDNIPEMIFDDVEFVFGIGGENKANSSSWILQDWKAPKTERPWGYWRVLHEQGKEVKLKELTVEPGQRLSMQRHQDRNEIWFVAEGTATLYFINPRTTDMELSGHYPKFKTLFIQKGEWHQLANETDEPLKIVEIQYGDQCGEIHIERK